MFKRKILALTLAVATLVSATGFVFAQGTTTSQEQSPDKSGKNFAGGFHRGQNVGGGLYFRGFNLKSYSC